MTPHLITSIIEQLRDDDWAAIVTIANEYSKNDESDADGMLQNIRAQCDYTATEVILRDVLAMGIIALQRLRAAQDPIPVTWGDVRIGAKVVLLDDLHEMTERISRDERYDYQTGRKIAGWFPIAYESGTEFVVRAGENETARMVYYETEDELIEVMEFSADTPFDPLLFKVFA